MADYTLSDSVTAAHAAADNLDSPLLRAIATGKLVRVRARGIPDAPAPMLASEGFSHWGVALKWRSAHQYDSVVLITGATGSGKSTLALRLAQDIDPTFDLSTRLCYTAAELLHVYETIQTGQVVLFDEGVRGLLAGDQMSVEQKALVQALALVREKGAILFVCAPSIWNIAKQVRQNRAWMWVHVLGRGLGIVHERNDYIRYVPDATLGFSRSVICPYLTWGAYATNSLFIQEYRRVKTEHLNAYLKETKEMLESQKRGKGSKLDAKTAGEVDKRLKAGESWGAIAKDLQARGKGAGAAFTAPPEPSGVAGADEGPAAADGAVGGAVGGADGATDDQIEEALLTMPVYKIPALLHVGAGRVSRVKKAREIADYVEPV